MLPGTGAGRCHGRTSKKAISSITVRDYSIKVTPVMDAPLVAVLQHPLPWHTDAVGGRPPHRLPIKARRSLRNASPSPAVSSHCCAAWLASARAAISAAFKGIDVLRKGGGSHAPD